MKDQNVIACYDSAENAAVVLPWARHFAEHLNHKGVVEMHLDEQTDIASLPTTHNAILAVAAVDPQAPRSSVTHPATLLRLFKQCKTAYLCVPLNSHFRFLNSQFSTCLSLTHRREGKEKLVWASYLARFLGSSLTIVSPSYRDQGLRLLLRNNLRFVDKLFKPLDITYNTYELSGSSLTQNPDLQTLSVLAPSLLIARTTDTRDRDLIDLFLPLPERRLLQHPSHTPILFLNPRDDLYILCD